MIGLSIKYLKYNKKQTFTLIVGIILVSVLLFSVGILFSSFRMCLINEIDDYHVKISGNLNNVSSDMLSSFKVLEDKYFIKFKDIKKTYMDTKKLCKKNECKNIVYNTKLLSFYGIGENNYLSLFKELLFLMLFILGISVFFIIYNSFGIMLLKKRKDIVLFKVIGGQKIHLCKIFLGEIILCGVIGILFGFLISLILNSVIINLINVFFKEIITSKMKLDLYFPFILISLLFILLITFFAGALPLFKINKFGLFKDRVENFGKLSFKFFTLSYAYNNYVREQKKYKSLVLCIFILIILFNSFVRLNDYVFKITGEYVKIPKYDLKLEVNKRDYFKLNDVLDFFDANKKIMYRSCVLDDLVLKGNYTSKAKEVNYSLVTDLGGNKVLNLVSEVLENKGKMVKLDYNIFSDLKEVNNIKVVLSNEIPFGFENELIEGRMILNLNDDDFNKVCSNFKGNVLFKTKKNNLDKKVIDYAKENDFENFSYVNVKKAYEMINSFIFLIKLFTYFCVCLVFLIALFTIFNIVSASVKFRKREFSILKSLGFDLFKINLCLLFESFIISGKGAIYAFPFILFISNSLYKNLGNYFKVDELIFDYRLYLFSFFFCFLTVFVCMFISHFSLSKKSIIKNIQEDRY